MLKNKYGCHNLFFLSFGVSDLIIAAEVTKEIKFTETNTPTSHPQEE
jgi:hypothetical protein